jgi:cellulose synthase/poly-beta-1,6-N-acetylglucosamine synthase-like glycosyltransferase
MLGTDGGQLDRDPTDRSTNNGRLLGEILRGHGAVSGPMLDSALDEQRRSGGRLGEILVANGDLCPHDLKRALSEHFDVPAFDNGHVPIPSLPGAQARALRAVALSPQRAHAASSNGGSHATPVALSDPSNRAIVEGVAKTPIQPRVVTEQELDGLLAAAYADQDSEELPNELRYSDPELSARSNRLSSAQLAIVGVLALLALVSALINPLAPLIAFAALGTAFFIVFPSYRFFITWQATKNGSTIAPDAPELAELSRTDLPLYTILLPMYGEKPATVSSLIAALGELDYPKHKLDAIALIEADDAVTQGALDSISRPPWLRVLKVPREGPRTKPKALMYGLRNARGKYLTVYDAEDRPEPDQLLRAVWAYAHQPERVACLQAKLNYYNPRQNLLTRWCTLEYDAWFDMTMPGLHRTGAPIPLGGTSNHFRIDHLRACGAWDPYNVTEDADLGLRLARLGYVTKMLESTTWEEAPSKLGVWMRQRSRWIKGYMQTFLVHSRNPGRLWRELGARDSASAALIVGGSVVTTLISPIFYAMLILWIVAQPAVIAEMFPSPLYYFALASLVLGNFGMIMMSAASAVARRQDDLIWHALLIPIYWLLMSAAAYRALRDLIVQPHHWHKTEHGLADSEKPAALAEATV